VDDLVLLTKGMIREENRFSDPMYPLVPWSDEKYQSKDRLKIGYFVSEDLFGASKACKRAVREAVGVLERSGHKLVEIKFPNFTELIAQFISIAFIEGKGRRHLAGLAGEKPIPELDKLIEIANTSDSFRSIMLPFVNKRIKMILEQTKELSANEVVLSASKFCELRNHLLKYWTDLQLDAVICPALGLPAFKHELSTKVTLSACYLWPANIANCPSGVVPVTNVLPGEDYYSPEDSLFVGDSIFEGAQENMEGSAGLPVSVQVMALPWEDEKCLAVMKSIEEKVNFHYLPVIN